MSELDLKDRKILYELDLNARQSDSQLATKVGLTRDAVSYRINRLQEQNYIHYFMTVINSMKLGYMWFRTFFKFQNIPLEKEDEILHWLSTKASWVTKVEGKWDVNTGIFCRNVYDYRDIINELLIRYRPFIREYSTNIVTRMWHYHRDYLIGKKIKDTKPLLMGHNPGEKYESITIDEIDYKILNFLLNNARAKTVEIAKALNSTEMIVKYRTKKLIDNGIILGFRPFLNVNQLGFKYFKVHFQLGYASNEEKDRIFSYIHQHPNTVHTTELVGGADLETEFQFKTNEELYENLKIIREKFGKTIREYEFMQYTKEYKFTYLPPNMFDQTKSEHT